MNSNAASLSEEKAPTVAYVMSRFPKISETYVLHEMDEVARNGIAVSLYALRREHQAVVHPEAARWVDGGMFGDESIRATLAAQAYWLRRAPLRYARTWLGALWMNLRSPSFLLRAVYIVPTAALFARKMAEGRTSHIHAHFATHAALAAWVAARLARLPYSVTVHAHDLYVNRTGLRKKMRDARFVVTISEFNAHLLESEVPGTRIEVIRTGTNPGQFSGITAHPGATFTILAVGSLEPYKGHRYLVEACAALARAALEFRCVIVGEGPQRPELERLITQADLGERCRLSGAATHEKVRETMAEADVLVLPSVTTRSGKMEGLPVVLMEAMAMGLPVVASNLSGIPELVTAGVEGLLVPERDPQALAAALEILAGDPDLRTRMGAAGRVKILESFDQRESARSLAALFRGARHADRPELGRSAGVSRMPTNG